MLLVDINEMRCLFRTEQVFGVCNIKPYRTLDFPILIEMTTGSSKLLILAIDIRFFHFMRKFFWPSTETVVTFSRFQH